MNGWFVGIDGGGTKSTLLLHHADGTEHLGQFGPLNANGNSYSEVDSSIHEILSCMQKTMGSLSLCTSVCIGGAGVSNSNFALFLKKRFADSGFSGDLLLVGDHLTALADAFSGNDGVVLISGTGSVCFGQHGELTKRCGGYGYLIDDEGSGYAVGRDILSAVVKGADGRQMPTVLEHAALEMLGLSDITELMQFLYSNSFSKKKVASLSVLLQEGIDNHDEASVRIEEKALRHLQTMAATVIHDLCLENGGLALRGGMLENSVLFRQKLSRLLQNDFPNLLINTDKGNPARGAVLLAMKEGLHGVQGLMV